MKASIWRDVCSSRGLAVLWWVILLAGAIGSAGMPDHVDSSLLAPSGLHWLGTDLVGRDVFLRLAQGGGATAGIAIAAVLISLVFGVAWGVIAGVAQGTISNLLTRLLDVALAVPALLMALVWTAAFGPGTVSVILAVGISGVATVARLARAEAGRIAAREYVTAARALGASPLDIFRRHLLPNMLPAVAAFACIQFGWAITNVTALTFLGFGGSLFVPDWGRILGEARLVFWQAPWQALAAGAAIACTALAAQQMGERWTDDS
jgi:peptide/nickel transport system permease protein